MGIAVYCLLPYLWFALTSWKSPAGAHRDSAEVDSFLSLGLLSFGLGRAWIAPLHRQQRHRRRRCHLHQHRSSVLWRPTLWRASSSRGRRVILLLLLAISMFPQIAIAGPVWNLLNHFGWLNTYRGLVAAYIAFSLPLATWILTTFFREVPHEIEEAALIDGCSRLQALYKIVLPISAPGIFTAALLVFIYAWNEFFFALIILTDPDMQTLPVGIALFPGEYTMPWGEIAAASTLATLPLITSHAFISARHRAGVDRGGCERMNLQNLSDSR